jgi:hypothetical protein
MESSGAGSRETRLTAMGVRCAEHATSSPQMLALTSPTSGGRSFGIACLQTKATEFSFYQCYSVVLTCCYS